MTVKDKDRIINAILAIVTSFIVAFAIFSFQVKNDANNDNCEKIRNLEINKADRVEVDQKLKDLKSESESVKVEILNRLERMDKKQDVFYEHIIELNKRK
jgi:mannitol-specific phosphotransferase system IIBC component